MATVKEWGGLAFSTVQGLVILFQGSFEITLTLSEHQSNVVVVGRDYYQRVGGLRVLEFSGPCETLSRLPAKMTL